MKLALTCIAIAGSLALSSALAAEHTKDSLATVKEKLTQKKAVLVDVREQKEWDRGHLKDARLLPLSELNRAASSPAAQEKLRKDLPKEQIIYCHCAHGVRALMAGGVLEKLGYDVRPLAAGFEELRDEGFPVDAK